MINKIYYLEAASQNPVGCQLSQFENETLLKQWASDLNVMHPTDVVIVDDYLDPRLALINLRCLRQQRPWLLVKPTGHQPLVGPYFSPGDPEAPCWRCLATRLRHNQPARFWLQGAADADLLPIPICYDSERVLRAMTMAATQMQSLVDTRPGAGLFVLNIQNQSVVEHLVSRRPQCTDCGDNYLFTQQSVGQIALKSSPKIYTHDGGFRSCTPAQTLAKLESIISPLTGVIQELSALPSGDPDGVTIYRSSFFRTPLLKQRLGQDNFIQTALGKSISAEQSKASALCEAVERYAAQYQGDESQYLGLASQLDARALLPQELAPFSDRQYRRFRAPQHPDHHTRQTVEPYHMDTLLNWTLGCSLTRSEPVYVPLTFCYANTPFDDERYVRFNSNGCAAGNTLEEAILQGLLELVERNAVAIWWYNRITRPSVALSGLSMDQMQPLRAALDGAWEHWVLNLTHDLGIPVMAAIGCHREMGTYRLGFGCHLDARLACLRALTELCQLIALPDRGAAAFDFSKVRPEPFLMPQKNAAPICLADVDTTVHADIQDDVRDCVARVAELGHETIVVNYTRPDLPLYTVKVIVPGLCHIWPRLGAERLYTVPLALRWHSTRLQEEQLNPTALFL